jgi:flagellar biosynthesis/type III secretory pathway protein FliH
VRLIKRKNDPNVQKDGPDLVVKPVDLRPISKPLLPRSADGRLLSPLELAKEEAGRILQSAREQAQTLMQSARDEGYNAGLQQAAKDAAALLKDIENILEDAIAARNKIIDDTEPVLLKLLLECVEKITRHEIRTNPRVIERVLKYCLKQIKGSGEVWIRVSPNDVERVKAIREELLAIADSAKALHVTEDASIEPGGCVVESSSGILDAQLSTRFHKVREALVEAFLNNARQSDSRFNEILRGTNHNGNDSS